MGVREAPALSPHRRKAGRKAAASNSLVLGLAGPSLQRSLIAGPLSGRTGDAIGPYKSAVFDLRII